MFDESKHPRDDRGRFTEGTSRRYAQNMRYGDIVREDREKEKSHYRHHLLHSSFGIRGLQYRRYDRGMGGKFCEGFEP